MEYVDIEIGVPSIVGHSTALGNTDAPSNIPVYRSSIFETENIQDFFIELEIGGGATRVATSGSATANHSVQKAQVTVWTKIGSDYKRCKVDTNQNFNETYIINIGANASGTSLLTKSALLMNSSITPYIGSRTYITIEPNIDASEPNPKTAWDWINGSDQVPTGDVGFGSGVGYEGYIEIKSIKAFLVVNKDNN